MSTEKSKMCGMCERQHKTVSADVWCPECEEFLCKTCEVHHSLAKLSENHQTVKMSDVQNLPSLVMEMKTNCTEHNHKLEFFCPKHEVPFCTLCTPQHQDCGEMTVIRHMPNIKSSSMMTDIQQNLKDLHDGIEAIYKDRQTNLSLLTEQEDKCRSQIKQIRKNINRSLDKLEKTILEELGAIYVKHKSNIENFLQELDLHRTKLTRLQDDIVKINKHASDIQAFLSALKIQNILHKEDDYMRSAMADKRISRVEISLTEYYKGDILPKFGKFDIVTKPSDIAIRKEKDKQAQILVPRVRKQISQLSVQKTLDIDLSNVISNAIITGCTTAEDGSILLADQKNDRIIVLSPDCLFICQNIALKSKPNDIVHSKGIAFVSSFSGRSVIRVDLKKKKITKEIKFTQGCDAMSGTEDEIIVHVTDCEYKILDLNLTEVGKIPINKSNCPFLACLKNKIYFACWTNNVVYCYDRQGNVVWELNDPKLNHPYGLGIDDNGYVFVSCVRSHNILVISPNGDRCRELVDLHGVLEFPFSVDFNRQTKKLLVTSNKSLRLVQYDVLQ